MIRSSLRSEFTPHRLALFRPGLAQPLIVQHAAPDARAFIHPILAPDGDGELTENEPPHHPWQHGLYVGLNDVNGTGFWTEGRLANHGPDGTFHPQPMTAPKLDGATATWRVTSDWRAPAGSPLLTETQTWSFEDRESTFRLDLDWTLTARVDLRFGPYPYGGLFLRMPWRKETGGTVLTSEGAATISAAEGRPARWVAIAMPVPGRATGPAGMALFDHPTNPVYPSPWRVDNNLGIAPSRSIAGAWTLAAGEATRSRYRLNIFTGAINAGAIEAAWQDYSAE
jgi:hypothetical protein